MSLSIVWGLAGGLVATIVMTALMAPMMRKGPGLPAFIGARATGADPTSKKAMMAGMGGHFLYGTVQGGVFAAGASLLLIVNPLITGLLFAVLLFLIAAAVIMPLARAPKMPGPFVAAFFVVHLVYGAVLGAVTAWLSGVAVL